MTSDSRPRDTAPHDMSALIEPARVGLFIAALALVWVTLNPYMDLSSSTMIELANGREGLTYAAFFVLACAACTLVMATQALAVTALATPVTLMLAGWLIVSVGVSEDVGTSARRFILFLLVAALAASLFLLPKGRDQLARLLLIASGGLAALSLLGVALFPENAIHQSTDIVEAQLAGDWRGVFGHKNTAGAIFAMCIFFAIFAARAGYLIAGAAVAGACALLLGMSGAKSSAMLLVVTLAVSGFVAMVPNMALRAMAVASPLVVLMLLGPLTVLNDSLAGLVRSLPVDVTFTGRTDVWTLAFDKIEEKPITGYGFSAFWTLESTKFGSEDNESWAGEAAHAHNGYIDTLLNMGVPGLVLTMLVFMVQPFRDFAAARRADGDHALTMMLFQVWLFGTYLSVMESFLYVRSDPIWFTFLFAVFGLRFMAAFGRVRT